MLMNALLMRSGRLVEGLLLIKGVVRFCKSKYVQRKIEDERRKYKATVI